MTIGRLVCAFAGVVSIVGAIGCAPAPRQRPIRTTPIAQGPGTLQEARKFLEGRWSLMSFEIYPPGRQPVALKGSGVLTYDDFGNLRMEVRTDEETAKLLEKAGIATQGGVISSEGRTVIDLQNRRLTYVIEGQPTARDASGPLAMSRPRYWEVEGDVLTLTTKDDSGEPLSVAKWQRER
jgi:hypothetical protein